MPIDPNHSRYQTHVSIPKKCWIFIFIFCNFYAICDHIFNGVVYEIIFFFIYLEMV